MSLVAMHEDGQDIEEFQGPRDGPVQVRALVRQLDARVLLAIAGALALGLGLLAAIRLLARPLALLILAITIAQALAPLVTWLERRLPRTVSILLVYLGAALAFALVGWLVVPTVISQARDVLARAPELVTQAQQWLGQWDSVTGGRLTDALASRLTGLGQSLLALPIMVTSWLLEIVLVLFLSVYWLIEEPKIRRFFLSLVPEDRRGHATRLLSEMGQSMGGYVRGVVIDAVIMGILAGVGLFLIGVQYPLALGAITMVAELVPIVGPIIATLPVVGVALLQSPTKALLALGLFVVLQQVESQILTPNIMRRETNVSQVLVLVALFTGAAVGNLLGALVAIPLAGALQVLAVRVVAPVIRQWTGAAEARLPQPAPAEPSQRRG